MYAVVLKLNLEQNLQNNYLEGQSVAFCPRYMYMKLVKSLIVSFQNSILAKLFQSLIEILIFSYCITH